MNKYSFYVEVCGGYCDGTITVEAADCEKAHELAQDSFVYRWCEAFPELEVDYDVELCKVKIDIAEIERKLQKARELLPVGEELEINSDGEEVWALRYLEARGSAERIDGVDEPLWYTYDEELDEEFDPHDLIKKYADAICM